MTFVEHERFAGSRTEEAILKIAWEGEIFGVGLFERWAEMYPEHADKLTAVATMEWFNVHYMEPFGHDASIAVPLERAEWLGREGRAYAEKHRKFDSLAKLMGEETKEADELYERLGKGAKTPELKTLAQALVNHENSILHWLKSEADGKPDDGEKVFGYLKEHGISREEAVTPRKLREDIGGDQQHLVLAFFDTGKAADQAAAAMKNWEKATDYMKVDAIGVVAKDENGKIKEEKLGKRAGKKGMGIGVALGIIAAIPTGGLSLIGSAAGGVVGGGVVGEFFHKGIKMTDEDVTRIGRELDNGHAAVGVLAWDFEKDAVADKLKELGGTPETHEVAKVTAAAQ